MTGSGIDWLGDTGLVTGESGVNWLEGTGLTPTSATSSTSADLGGLQREAQRKASLGLSLSVAEEDALRGLQSAARFVGTVGKAIQPFAAPQQVIFGGIGAIEDILSGNGADDAWNTLKRGGSSALAYLTYQHGGDLPGVLKNRNAPQANPITGYELFKRAGAPDHVARWGGTAADFLVDVPLLGTVGKAAKLDRLTAGLKIGENMAQAFDSPAALRAFVGGVAAAPFTTQPIRRMVEAVPVGLRQGGRERLIDPLLNSRHVPADITQPVSPTRGQLLISRTMGVPEPVQAALARQQAVQSQYTVLHNGALQAFDRAGKGLSFGDKKALDDLVGRLADESNPGARVGIEGELRALETRTGRTGLYDDAVRAVNKGIQFDVFSAEKLNAAGLMSEEALKKYQTGDKRHLRRLFAMYGEKPEDHIRRIYDRNAPASVTFDTPALTRLYSATLNPSLPPAPPALPRVTERTVAVRGGELGAVDPARLERQAAKRGHEFMLSPEGALYGGDARIGIQDYLDARPELGDRYAHGIRTAGAPPVEQLVTLLRDGFDQGRTVHTIKVSDRGKTSGAAHYAADGSPFVLLSRPGDATMTSGVDTVLVSHQYRDSIPELQRAFPQVTFVDARAGTTYRGASGRSVTVKADGNVVEDAIGKSTPTRVGAFPGRTPILDPVADANRPVWREVPREVEVGTFDRGNLDLGNLGQSEITSLRNVLGWEAVKKVDGKWRVVGGVSDSFPVGHPVIERLFGDLRADATNIRVEPGAYREQVPNFYNPREGNPLEVQRAYSEQELAETGGALYIHTRDLDGFMAGATDAEVAAFERATERLPMRERGNDSWFPVDPADADMVRLIERAKGGAASLFDGVTGQPTLGTVLPDKSSPKLPSGQEFAEAVQKAYTNPDQHPADFLRGFFTERGMSEGHIARVLEGIGKDYAEKAGIAWRPSDRATAAWLTRKRAEGGAGGQGGRGVGAATTERLELDDGYMEVLGQIDAFTKRITEQSRVASKAAGTNGVIREIRQYLTGNDLIERVDVNNTGSILKTAGLRVVSEDLARKLGNDFQPGEVIPAEVHRILAEQVTARKDAPLGLAWQWYSSRWQGIKLANPASILTNLRSGFVMADHAGHSMPDLMRGMADYLRLHHGATKRGDGGLDTAHAVNGVTMKEVFENGAFTHNTLLNAEVVQRSSRLMDELANPAGSGLQQRVASIQTWLTETAGGQRATQAYGTAVAPMRWLGDTYGRVDSLFKGGLYMSLRRKGMNPQDAARIADETFFNYENVPYVVDGLRKLGLAGMPFASFKFLATGRFFRSLYQNPYGVERYYRLPNSSQAAMADAGELEEYEKGSPEYVRKGLYIPLGKDSEGRHRAVRLDDVLPESALWDLANGDNVASVLPPIVQLAAQLSTGVGYQDRDVYRGGGSLASVAKDDPREAARGVVKQLWQFGAYPWAPGQPMTERIVKALADKSVPVETIQDPTAQAVLKVLTEGPAAPLDRAPWTAEKKGTAPVPDRADALARVLGIKSYPVDPNPGRPGSAYYNRLDLDERVKAIDRRMDMEMKQAQTEAQREEIRARYAAMRAPLLQELRGD